MNEELKALCSLSPMDECHRWEVSSPTNLFSEVWYGQKDVVSASIEYETQILEPKNVLSFKFDSTVIVEWFYECVARGVVLDQLTVPKADVLTDLVANATLNKILKVFSPREYDYIVPEKLYNMIETHTHVNHTIKKVQLSSYGIDVFISALTCPMMPQNAILVYPKTKMTLMFAKNLNQYAFYDSLPGRDIILFPLKYEHS